MNSVEIWIEQILSVKEVSKTRDNVPILECNMVVNSWGNRKTVTERFKQNEWLEVCCKGYYMG